MSEPTREELLAQLAALQRQLAIQSNATQDHNTTANDRGVAIGGNATNSPIITGDQVTYYGSIATLNIASAVFQAPPPPGQIDPKALLWTYLNQIVVDTGTLPLTGIDRQIASDQTDVQVELAAIYTALDTLRSAPGQVEEQPDQRQPLAQAERKRLSVLAFVNSTPAAALLGDPGSGKTTFANFLALCLAGELLGLPHVNLTRLGVAWSLGPLLPARIVLRDFAAGLGQTALPAEDLLWSYLTEHLKPTLPGFVPLLHQHWVETGGLLILDGLDEVPEAQQRREQVKAAVLAFRRAFPRVRILLTSRTYAYQRQQWQLPGFEEAVLAPFNDQQIATFITNWYAHMAHMRHSFAATEAQGRATLLQQAIERNPRLHELATRPLLLTLMASLHAWRNGSLPAAREQLYAESVELLLDIWERPKIVHDAVGRTLLQTESMAEWLRSPQADLRKALEQLAYTVHARQPTSTGPADISEGELVVAFMRAARDPELKQERVIEYIRDRAGLLTNRADGIYSFPHRTFQEYLAARYLTENGFPNQLVKLVRTAPERWREVLLLAGAKVARGTPFAAWTLVAKLCPQPYTPPVTDEEWWSAFLAGQLLVETGIYKTVDPNLDQDDVLTLERVRTWLVHLITGGNLAPVDRAAAGTALGWLGDPRRGVTTQGRRPDIDWAPIKAGPFPMGGDRRTDRLAQDDETPKFICRLIRQPYAISRYPITVAQYACFIADHGYANRKWWTAAGWQWRLTNQVTRPRTFGGVFETPNHPQVGVNWYEAVAFCHWLSARLGFTVRLPTEAEWERAARHVDGRIYPWGNKFEPTRCNMGNTGIGTTTPVGLFPCDQAVSEVADLSGNIWEWCSTKWLEGYKGYTEKVDDDLAGTAPRVLRGGSFLAKILYVRCGSRDYFAPDHWNLNVGFRIVAPEVKR